MSLTVLRQHALQLSFCISTRNRGNLIGATLDSILNQATPECEVVVVDGASTDDTEHVVGAFTERHKNVRYFKQKTNGGVDGDFDRAVELASGEYCWLLPDDDLLKPGAIKAILDAIQEGYFLVLINREHRDATTSRVLVPSLLEMEKDRVFSPNEVGELFQKCWMLLTYVGCFVIRRQIWLARDRRRYYGCDFIHVGVIFQEPISQDVLVIATPLISLRIGNQIWLSRSFEIWMISWPSLVLSLALPDSAKSAAILSRREWKSFLMLLGYRAQAVYSLAEYRRYIRPRLTHSFERIVPILVAVIPGVIANTYCILRHVFFGQKKWRASELSFLRRSPVCCRLWRITE